MVGFPRTIILYPKERVTVFEMQPTELLNQRDPQQIKSLMPIWEFLYQCYFRVRAYGWETVPSQGSILFVGSHNGGLAAPDMYAAMFDWFRRFGFQRPAYGLIHPDILRFPSSARRLAKMGAVPATARVAIACLQRGAAVLVYPGGVEDVFRPYSRRDRIQLEGDKAFIKLALREEVPIVPIVSKGAHESLIVLTDCRDQIQGLHELGLPRYDTAFGDVFPIYVGLPWGIACGVLPNIPFPVQVTMRIGPAIRFDRYGRKAASDRAFVDACYERVRSQMQTHLDELFETRNP